MVFAIMAIGLLGFMVWGHHMFMSGMSPYSAFAFSILTMAIGVPSAIKTFNWLATMWRGDLHFHVPMLHALSFVALFVVGGLSGVFLASTPVDIYLHDTYFVVAHLHYVLFGGSLFGIFGAITYWFPKMFGKMMNPLLGKIHFWLTAIFFNLIFFPMHGLGTAGMMRRLYDTTQYTHLQPYQDTNIFISICAFMLFASQMLVVINFVWSLFKGQKATANPWNATTLEWQAPSPPPHGNWGGITPIVYRGPYEYSSPESETDYLPQTVPPEEARRVGLRPEPA
jgi:cytochrome c oxidase subunit 1